MMTKKQLNIALAVITLASLLLAFGLTSVSASISQNKVENKAKEEIVGIWTDSTNPQMIVQFTNNNVLQVMGTDAAVYRVNPDSQTVTLKYGEDYGNKEMVYAYTLNDEHTQLVMTDNATGQSITYTR